MPIIDQAAQQAGVDPKLLAAIALRESQGNNRAQGDGGLAMGYFQIDLGKNPSVTPAQAMDPTWAATWAANYLANSATQLQNAFPGENAGLLQEAVAASYNHGVLGEINNLTQGQSPDFHTAGHNYGSDIINLEDCFQ